MVETNIRVGGGVVFWSIGEWTQLGLLQAGLEAEGFTDFAPETRTPQAALREALEEAFPDIKHLVRPLKTRDGFTVVSEERGEEANAYRNELLARIDPQTLHISFAPYDDRAQGIVDSFNRHLGLLRAGQVSGSLVRILDSLGATRLRPSGAVYWLPEYHLGRWQRVAGVVEQSGLGKPNAVYVIRHQMDADAMRAIRDAIVAEVSTEAARIKREVQTGELGERALEHRQQVAAELRQKIGMYEDLLGIGLERLHIAVDEADQAAGLAAILAAAQAGPETEVAAGAA